MRFQTRYRTVLLVAAASAIGFAPIVALALALAGLWPLAVGAPLLILPACVGLFGLTLRFPTIARLATQGFGAGLVAVLAYDLARWPTVAVGLWGDFIPALGGWLLDRTTPHWLLGYLFRWLGDGGGMGLAFAVAMGLLRPQLWLPLAGVLYGIGIWLALLATLLGTPHGQALLFPLTPTTFLLSLAGHLIYGGVLGGVLAWWGNPRMRVEPSPVPEKGVVSC